VPDLGGILTRVVGKNLEGQGGLTCPFCFLEAKMKTSEQEESVEELGPDPSRPSDNGSRVTTAQASQSMDAEQSGSSKPRANKGNSSSLARRATGPRTPAGKERSKQNARKHGIFSKVVLLKEEPRTEFNSLLQGLREDLQPEGTLEEVLVEKLAALLWRHRRLMIAETAEIRKEVEFLDWEEEQHQEEWANTISDLTIDFPGGLMRRIENPIILQKCLDLLDDLKMRFEKRRGFDAEQDKEILIKLCGPYNKSYWRRTLLDSYIAWMSIWSLTAEERRQKEYSLPPENCVQIFLEEIAREKMWLNRYKKARASIEAEKMHLEVLRRNVPEAPELDRLLRYEASLDRSFDRTLGQLERLQRLRAGQPVLPELKVRLSG